MTAFLTSLKTVRVMFAIVGAALLVTLMPSIDVSLAVDCELITLTSADAVALLRVELASDGMVMTKLATSEPAATLRLIHSNGTP